MMSLPVLVRPEASRDAEQTRDCLDMQRGGLGQAFLDRLHEALNQIGMMLELYGIVWRNVRAARLRQFTYVVYYRVHDDRIEVLAVLHGSRRASAWKSRA